MTRKLLATCVLLIGLLIATPAIAEADTIAFSSVSLTNFQLVSASGTVVFSAPLLGSPTAASGAVANSLREESANSQQSPTHSQASATVNFANASGMSDLANGSLTASSSVTLSGCVCSAETEGLAFLNQSFMIVGGTGSVAVTLSALLETTQNLVTDQFSLFAASDARISLQVLDEDGNAFNSHLNIGPSASLSLQMQKQFSQVIMLQFGQQYSLQLFVGANARAAQSEIPEPATMVLLISGLGFMAGFVRKRRES